MFIGKFNKTVIVTYLSIVSFLIGSYCALFEQNITVAIICLIISGICDSFDGKIARMCKNRTEEDKNFGIQIDSLADIIAFTIFPLVIFYGYLLKNNININPILIIIASSALVVCGITRLAYFNVVASSGEKIKYYSGMPVTLSSPIFVLLYILDKFLEAKVFAYVYLIAIFIVALLFVLNFKVKKPTGKLFFILIPIISLIVTLIILFA